VEHLEVKLTVSRSQVAIMLPCVGLQKNYQVTDCKQLCDVKRCDRHLLLSAKAYQA